MGTALSKALLPLLSADMGLQTIAWVVAAFFKTESFYDLVGSLTYWVLMALGSRGRMREGLSFRQRVGAGLVLLWSGRLGSFLLYRAVRDGGDSRFDKVRDQPLTFLQYWLIQGVWCFMTSLPVLALLSKKDEAEVGWIDRLGWTAWGLGFLLQVFADMQKLRFRANPSNRGKFIQHGAWALSQHPNYAGEILMWSSLWLTCTQVFSVQESLVTMAGPAFTYFILNYLSGIPMLDRAARKKWGKDPTWVAYVSSTPVLWPFIGRPSNLQPQP
eukprot:gb/GEZN01010332.1/.p1 GENE.gb/GEZN01010332.1/~~gb/GEZN01010332.1/.p1  ORF type:complete len:272 (-),score=19.69 gb/GEZN01010332.1/:336-1151(-)